MPRQPILGQLLARPSQNARRQVGQLAAIHQNQEPTVLRQKAAALALLRMGPANPLFPGFEVQRGGRPPNQGQPLAAMFGHVTELVPGQVGVFEVMQFTDQGLGAGNFFRAEQAHGQFIQHLLLGAIGQSNRLGHARNMNQALEVVHFLFKIHHVNRPLLSYLESALRKRGIKAPSSNIQAPEKFQQPSSTLPVAGGELSGGSQNTGFLQGLHSLLVGHPANAVDRQMHGRNKLFRRWLRQNNRLFCAVNFHRSILTCVFHVSSLW
jgi:hypothetical protein